MVIVLPTLHLGMELIQLPAAKQMGGFASMGQGEEGSVVCIPGCELHTAKLGMLELEHGDERVGTKVPFGQFVVVFSVPKEFRLSGGEAS